MHLKKRSIILIISSVIFICLFSSVTTIQAAIICEREFADTYFLGEKRLALRGGGLKRYLGFKTWISCLYLEEHLDSSNALSDVPKKIEIEYLLRIPSEEIARATYVGIKNNITKEEYLRIQDKINLANSLWPDVKRGDRYEVIYSPEQGTFFVFNGKLQRVIDGADFARAFFSIWIGNNPIDRRLRKQMLGIDD